jgi:hypothetical protein
LSDLSAIESMLERNVEWTDLPEPETTDGLYAVKQGVLELGALRLRSYVLNNGERVFDADDVGRYWAGATDGERAA